MEAAQASGTPDESINTDGPPTNDELKRLILLDEKFDVYLDLRKVPYPKEMPVHVGPVIRMDRREVQKIEFPDNPLNGFTWYGVVNSVTAEAIPLLASAPLYTCEERAGKCCMDYTWASYNPKIGKTQLDAVCKGLWSSSDGRKKEVEVLLKLPRVFRFSEATD